MKVFLLYRDRDSDLERSLPWNEADLVQDLDLTTLCNAMAAGDAYLFDIAKRGLLLSLTEPEAIVYRQQVLTDCLDQPALVRELYGLAVEAGQAERKVWGFFARSPDSILYRSVQVLELLLGTLKRVRKLAEQAVPRFKSAALQRFCTMLVSELDDAYLQAVEGHLRALKFPRGALLSAELGQGNKGTHYVLRTAPERSWIERLVSLDRSGYSFQIAERDESGFRALGELRERGINLVANALAQSVDHVVSFFTQLRAELGFYVGCLNLQGRLRDKGEPTCLPTTLAPSAHAFTAQGFYDVCLSLRLDGRAVGNDVQADGKALIMITGANQGGKSTFLRSVGVAHLMMQCGMFVSATTFAASVCQGLYTHFKREEDPTMRSGKLDEELSRMSQMADRITPRSLLLCNESFASTNEREGSEIARQIIHALVASDITVVYVTHLYDLAHGFFVRQLETALFLRAERLADGTRTFCVVPGEPLPTSHGEDAYRHIFEHTAGPSSKCITEQA